METNWFHLPEHAAWSARKSDRGLDGVGAEELPLHAPARTQHCVIGVADTDRRLSKAVRPRIRKEAARSSRTQENPS